jgi:hypothetical protein
MKLLDKIGREFSDCNIVESGKRLFRCHCAVGASLLGRKPVRLLRKEILSRAKRVPSILRTLSDPRTNDLIPGSITNPNGTYEVNGSSDGGPAADTDVSSRECV